MDCSNSQDEIGAKNAQKFLIIETSESPNLCSSSNSNEVSRNSTDNLSYSPHDHIDEILFQNTLSDEDEHGSVDCVYAYRGAGADRNEEQIINNENDDETDFLEMDFDPDPPSEIEQNLNTCNSNGFDQQELFEKEILLMNEQLLKSVEKFSTNSNTLNDHKEERVQNLNVSNNILNEGDLETNIKDLDPNELIQEAKFESTGAKPKKGVEMKITNGNHSFNVNYKNKKQLSAQRSYEFNAIEKYKTKHKTLSNNSTFENENHKDDELTDDICLDCLEKEFLSKIIGKDIEQITLCNKCKVNQNKSLKTFCDSSIGNINNNNIHLNSLEGINKFEMLDLNTFSPKNNRADLILLELHDISKITSCDKISAESFSGSIKISSINYDAVTLTQALNKLDVEYDESLIYKYMDDHNSNFNTLYDFILYSSKKNCNYKKLINILNLASKDKIKIDFQFDESKTFQTVQVKVCDILYYWQINHDLMDIKSLDHRFKEMNVLGKLVNKIRQAQQRVTKQQLNDFITIPQYYRPGYITITKE